MLTLLDSTGQKLIIPIILVFAVVVAGVFAFIPIDNATSVHTTIMENTQRIDEIAVPFVGVDDDLIITCPAASDGCRILEIFFLESTAGAAEIDLGIVNATINGARTAVIVADLNTQVNDSMEAIAGVSGITIGGGDILRIEVVGASSASTAYNATVFIQTEGNTAATAVFQ